MAKVDVGPLSLNVVTKGDDRATPLLLAHPLGADLTVWDEIAPVLAEKFLVVRFDARGHGLSDIPPGPYSLADLGRDVVSLLDALGFDLAHFLGLSMSGATGQWLMIHAPNRLGKVVLANTATHFPGAEGWNARIRAVRTQGMAALAAAVAERWLSPAFRAADPAKFEAVEGLLRAAHPDGYAACCSALRDADLRDEIRSAPARPALVIIGEKDASAPPPLGEALARSLPGAKLVRLPAAHLSCVEAKAAFLAAVAEFLD